MKLQILPITLVPFIALLGIRKIAAILINERIFIFITILQLGNFFPSYYSSAVHFNLSTPS
jgi:hypothetical protein